jgi:dihydropteroate synthase
MRFHEAANYLFGLRRFDPRPGTDATAALLAHLGDPQEGPAVVQVAGTNGKGSTARMVESVLSEAGLDVGLYTSPHLDDLRERIRVNGRTLTKAALTSFVERARPYITDRAAEGDPPTFFETVTALALWEFGRQNVDVAVLEVGIGGRHDATSVVDPIASAVTTVTLEHTDVLGDDIETIARDKAGVAPADRALVTAAEGTARETIRETVDDVTLVSAEQAADVRVTYGGRDGLEGVVAVETDRRRVETRLPLLGEHQARNAGVAVALVEQVGDALGETVETASLERGLRNAHWPGRFEVFGRDPLVVLDCAHNPRGCACVAETLAEFSVDELHLVVGALTDKDHRGIAAALEEASQVIACQPAHDRAEEAAVLARVFERETDAAVSTRRDVAGALAETLDRADAEDCVLVTGSLYTVAEARTRWTRTTVPKRVDSLATARTMLESGHVSETDKTDLAAEAVHEVYTTRVQPRQARVLAAELRAVGGECAVASLDEYEEERIPVVLMGTLAQFRGLCSRLDDRPHGLDVLAGELRASLGITDDGQTASGDPRTTSGGNPRTAGDSDYPWNEGTAVMGILNVTPDSFHDGGEFEAEADAVSRAEELVAAGADIVDVGGESTRPGAEPVPVAEEKARILPVIERIDELDALVSVDTRKAEVARAALDAGADILNDVSGLADPEMRLVAADYDVPVVVMHSIDAPVDPDNEVEYDDVVGDVVDALTERVLLAQRAGLDRSQIIVDPGLGFGKTSAESFELLDRLGEIRALGCPVLVGHSHKSMFDLVGKDGDERYEATVAGTALAAERGADIVRVHDVAANAAAVDVVETARTAGESDESATHE